jgi:hypothetical protein
VEVAEKLVRRVSSGYPRSAAGTSPLTYLESMPNHENHLVSSAWLHGMGAFFLLVSNRFLVLKCTKTSGGC